MAKEIFQREAAALEQAQEALAGASGLDEGVDRAFRELVKRYAKLLRQSGRMVTMGDRMQNALNQLNGELAASESKYRGVFENVTEGIFRCGPDGTFIEVNPSLARMFGFADAEAFLGRVSDIRQLFPEATDYEQYLTLLASDSVRRREVHACAPGGACLWVELSAGVMPGGEGDSDIVVGVMADVTERRTMLEEMCRLARTDSLTGVWNRGYFLELAARETARSLRNGTAMSLLILDVDFFKGVNDSYGHDVGDRALVGVTGRMRASVREIDVVGRYGGEEFVVLLPDAAMEDACAVAERIRRNLRENPIECGLVRVDLTASIGMTSLMPGDDLDALLKFADIALYAAKKKGRDRVEAYRRQHCPGSGCHCAPGKNDNPEETR